MDAFLAQLPLLLLIAARLIGLMISSPVFSNRFVPAQVRFALSFVLAFILLPAVAQPTTPPEGAYLLLASLFEMLTGLVIGFVTNMVLAVMQIAGALIDLDMGFTLVNILDPITGHNDSILGAFFQSVIVVVYLLVNGHHLLIRALIQSYELVPAGTLIAPEGALHVVYMFAQLLSIAVQLVLPFIAVILVTMVAFAGVNRAVSQLNILSVGLGTKSLVGLLILVSLLPYLRQPMVRLVEISYEEIIRVLTFMRPTP